MKSFGRDFILLWQGQFVSHLGNQAFLVGTTFLILEQAGSARLVSLVMLASTLPMALLGPFGGTLADRYSRRSILVVSDLLRAVAVGVLAAMVHRTTTSHLVLLIVAVAGLNGVMAAAFNPTVQAIVPDLVRREQVASANSLNQISVQISILGGQAAAGFLYTTLGASGLLVVDASTFAYGALATSLIRRRARSSSLPTRTFTANIANHVLETKEGFQYVRHCRGMLPLLVVFSGVNFLFMPVYVLLPFYVTGVLGAEAAWFGYLLAASGGGALIGSAVAGAFLSRVPGRFSLVLTLVFGIAGCVLALSVTRGTAVALALFAAIGLLSAIVNVVVLTTFQLAVTEGFRGRVMALVISLTTATVPLGMALGGIAGDLWRESLPLVFAVCGCALALLVAIAAGRSSVRELLNGAA